MASPAQCLQATDMGVHISLGVLALAFKVVTDTLQVPAPPVDAAIFGRISGDVAVGRSWTRDNGSGFDDYLPLHFFDPARVLELDVMDPAINAVDNQVDPLAHLVAGKALGQNPAHNLSPGTLHMKGVLANAALLGKAVGGDARPPPAGCRHQSQVEAARAVPR